MPKEIKDKPEPTPELDILGKFIDGVLDLARKDDESKKSRRSRKPKQQK